MSNSSETFWINVVAAIVVVLCVAGIIAVAIREKRRTGDIPRELRSGRNEVGWFALVWWFWFFGRSRASEQLLRVFPLTLIVPGVDLALTIAFVAFAGYCVSYAFRTEWNWRVGPWITYSLVLPVLMGFPMYEDIKLLASMVWMWVPAGVLALALVPFFMRWTFEEFYLRKMR